MSERDEITLIINGRRHAIRVEPRRTLVDAIREDCGQTGTHIGCEHGVCGACTVLLDGAPVRSCLMFAVQADGKEIRTVEGLAKGDELTVVMKQFEELGAKVIWQRAGDTGVQFLLAPDAVAARVKDRLDFDLNLTEKSAVEAAGEIAAVGPGVTGLTAGDAVAPYGALTCGFCKACDEGRDNLCEDVGGIMGFHIDGFARELQPCPPLEPAGMLRINDEPLNVSPLRNDGFSINDDRFGKSGLEVVSGSILIASDGLVQSDMDYGTCRHRRGVRVCR